MKIAILGTRGIPNKYGGFEQLAERLAEELVARGHEAHVYCSSLHPDNGKEYKGVHLIHCFDPEDRIGTAGQFVYDFNCILDSRKRNFEIILQLGYTSNSIWSFLLPENAKIVTNMDGLEWKRSKYSKPVQQFLKFAEKRAVFSSDQLIADSPGIKNYLEKEYKMDSSFIAYGANPFDNPDESALLPYGISPFGYYLFIARFEPENNQEMIIQGYLESKSDYPLLLFGNCDKGYGKFLKMKYESSNVRFPGSNYDINVLNNLRYFCALYFHGHSVGGTNPSLLEAMASQALICAHLNEFNYAVLGEDGFYFSGPDEIKMKILSKPGIAERSALIGKNLLKVNNEYSWKRIVDAYENLFLSIGTIR